MPDFALNSNRLRAKGKSKVRRCEGCMDAPSPHAVVETFLVCERCRYNLTGLTEPRCPECGTTFVQTRRSSFVLHSKHILGLINIAALSTAILICWASPQAQTLHADGEGVFVWSMLAPMQWVLALAGLMVGFHAMNRVRPPWVAIAGMLGPFLFACFSLITHIQSFFLAFLAFRLLNSD